MKIEIATGNIPSVFMHIIYFFSVERGIFQHEIIRNNFCRLKFYLIMIMSNRKFVAAFATQRILT